MSSAAELGGARRPLAHLRRPGREPERHLAAGHAERRVRGAHLVAVGGRGAPRRRHRLGLDRLQRGRAACLSLRLQDARREPGALSAPDHRAQGRHQLPLGADRVESGERLCDQHNGLDQGRGLQVAAAHGARVRREHRARARPGAAECRVRGGQEARRAARHGARRLGAQVGRRRLQVDHHAHQCQESAHTRVLLRHAARHSLSAQHRDRLRRVQDIQARRATAARLAAAHGHASRRQLH